MSHTTTREAAHALHTGRVTAHANNFNGKPYFLGHTLDGKFPGPHATAEDALAHTERLDAEYVATLTPGNLRGEARDLEVQAELAHRAAVALAAAEQDVWLDKALGEARAAEAKLYAIHGALPVTAHLHSINDVVESVEATNRYVRDIEALADALGETLTCRKYDC